MYCYFYGKFISFFLLQNSHTIAHFNFLQLIFSERIKIKFISTKIQIQKAILILLTQVFGEKTQKSDKHLCCSVAYANY